MSALAVYVAQRALRLVTIIFVVVNIFLFAIIWLLAETFSGWWLILLIPFFIEVGIFLAIRFIVRRILSAIHRHPFTKAQREELEAFTAKLRSLAAVHATSLPRYAYMTLRDVVRDRDATTVRKFVEDSTTLKSDFAELEKNFGER